MLACVIARMLALLVMTTTGGCAGQVWQRDQARACGAADAPRVCLLAGPDAAQVVTIGGAALVSGECAAGSEARGGAVEVSVRDGRSGRGSTRKIRVRRGETAMISTVDGDVVVQERRSCARARR